MQPASKATATEHRAREFGATESKRSATTQPGQAAATQVVTRLSLTSGLFSPIPSPLVRNIVGFLVSRTSDGSYVNNPKTRALFCTCRRLRDEEASFLNGKWQCISDILVRANGRLNKLPPYFGNLFSQPVYYDRDNNNRPVHLLETIRELDFGESPIDSIAEMADLISHIERLSIQPRTERRPLCVVEMECDEKPLKTILNALTNLRTLDLNRKYCIGDETAEMIVSLRNLRTLRLDADNLPPIFFERPDAFLKMLVKSSPTLESFSIREFTQKINLRALEGLQNLTSLECRGADVTPLGHTDLQLIAKNHPTLTSLKLTCRISAVVGIQPLAPLTKLKELVFDTFNSIVNPGVIFGQIAEQHPQLESLTLDGFGGKTDWHVYHIETDHLVSLGLLKRLQSLIFTHCSFSPDCDFEPLARALPRLRKLELTNFPTKASLMGLQHFTKLTSLATRIGLTDEERFDNNDHRDFAYPPRLSTPLITEKLGSILMCMTDLQELHLGGDIPPSTEALQTLGQLPNFRELSLDGMTPTDELFTGISAYLPRLRRLNLTGDFMFVQCTEKGLQSLSVLNELISVQFSHYPEYMEGITHRKLDLSLIQDKLSPSMHRLHRIHKKELELEKSKDNPGAKSKPAKKSSHCTIS